MTIDFVIREDTGIQEIDRVTDPVIVKEIGDLLKVNMMKKEETMIVKGLTDGEMNTEKTENYVTIIGNEKEIEIKLEDH